MSRTVSVIAMAISHCHAHYRTGVIRVFGDAFHSEMRSVTLVGCVVSVRYGRNRHTTVQPTRTHACMHARHHSRVGVSNHNSRTPTHRQHMRVLIVSDRRLASSKL